MSDLQSPDQSPWQTLNSQIVYENPWIKVVHNDVINPAGNDGIYGVVHFQNLAVGVIPLDEQMNTWLVGQYRYPLNLYSWEIPEGGCPVGQEPLMAAQRELKEETGITATQWTSLGQFHISNSVTNETGYLFVAQSLAFGEATPEETEDLIIRKVPFSEAVEMVMQGQITDSLSVIGILKVHLQFQQGDLKK